MVSASLWIQFLRNFLCVLKSILGVENPLQQPFSPINVAPIAPETTLIEVLIAMSQFAAVFFNIRNGITNIAYGIFDYFRFSTLLVDVDRLSLTEKAAGPEYLVVRHGAQKERTSASKNVLVGILEFTIGTAYIFLVLGNLHIVGPTHPKPIIDALIFMEIALVYFIYSMWETYRKNYESLAKYSALSTLLKSSDSTQKSCSSILLTAFESGFGVSESMFEVVTAIQPTHKPSWKYHSISPQTCVQREIQIVRGILNKTTSTDDDGDLTRISVSNYLDECSVKFQRRAPLDLLYFALNFLACYGYMFCVLVFYFKPGEHLWLEWLKLGLSHPDADWWGNFIGDFSWTIEAFVLILEELFFANAAGFVVLPNSTTSSSAAKKNGLVKSRSRGKLSSLTTAATAVAAAAAAGEKNDSQPKTAKVSNDALSSAVDNDDGQKKKDRSEIAANNTEAESDNEDDGITDQLSRAAVSSPPAPVGLSRKQRKKEKAAEKKKMK